jgi:hypothetical protein
MFTKFKPNNNLSRNLNNTTAPSSTSIFGPVNTFGFDSLHSINSNPIELSHVLSFFNSTFPSSHPSSSTYKFPLPPSEFGFWENTLVYPKAGDFIKSNSVSNVSEYFKILSKEKIDFLNEKLDDLEKVTFISCFTPSYILIFTSKHLVQFLDTQGN